ncbi:hypothetical protein BDN70DRAFT_992516 [Pholiota conissans]|uniref:GH18 domain-containing protein n=1 Tax=Pholiota conissans TaxID=109636 RepID=A0A9P5Z616_9AGAR|nr:hypothetical protein BDN70DRAFT_992516 [Pholiota conissans]
METPDSVDSERHFAHPSLKEEIVRAIVVRLQSVAQTRHHPILRMYQTQRFIVTTNSETDRMSVVASLDFAGPQTSFVEMAVNRTVELLPYLLAQTATARRIGYYEGWAASRPCMAFTPEQIPATSLTHVNFAFALISSSFQVVPMNPGDEALWSRTTNLKSNAPVLKVFLSIGGWTFNDPPTQNIFSNLAASSANTQTFISSILSVLETYGFDGIDIDWEYPGAFDRGGIPSDTENYVTFMKAVKTAFTPHGYGLTFTAPSSYWYLQHFDLPNLMKYADWVNVMTYDLHGTWDGIDPFVGFVLGAHTNLTEIDEAFKLFWRVGVDPSQMVMGTGFYGRSFTLSEPSCFDPPCPWASGGKAGPCSNNAGTLMFSEIQTILKTSSAQLIFDEVAAVKYIIWDTNQWVSYDDKDTFALKMNYANDHCIGGTMIWSVDQDDTKYTAMTDLFPGITAFAGGTVEVGDQCTVSPCGATSCGHGKVSIASVITNPALPGEVCDLDKRALLCCPAGNAPTSWEAVLATDPVGDGNFTCLLGEQALCCETNLELPNLECQFFGCTSDAPSCPSAKPVLVTVGTRGQYAGQNVTCAPPPGVAEILCPPTCPVGQVKPFCCSDPIPYENCKWVGTPPLCLDSACEVGQVQVLTDPQGDASGSCIGGRSRSYCCDPSGSDFIPVPFEDIFPSNVPEGSETFTVDIDTDLGTPPSSSAWENDSRVPENLEKGPAEENTPFGEVFIDSPNPQSVSSLAIESHWVIVGCDPTSDQAQQVLAYCSKPMNESGTGCGHVFIGQAQHTIVKMPSGCGKGPYARVVGLDVHSDQNALPAMHNSLKPASESVHLLSFDYNFLAIPESNGPVYMRVDVSDLPDYWDSVVDSPPERRRWLQERGLWKEKTLARRWWGSFVDWLSKLNTVKSESTTTRQFLWSDTYPIFSQSESCPGPPAFESSMDIEVSGSAQFSARYGFYLQGQIVPPSVQAAYLFFSSNADARADFTVKGTASVTYDSSMVQLASFGFPGLYYPGILTIGPSLVLEGYITGELSISGEFTASLSYEFPSVDFALGKSNTSDQIPGGLNPTSVSPPLNKPIPEINWQVDLHGDLSVHIVPQVQMGISILGGALVDAQAFIRADLGGGISISGSVSNIQKPDICINPYFSVEFDAGITGSLTFWETGPLVFPLFSDKYNYPPNGYCPLSLDTREISNFSSTPYSHMKLSPAPNIERRGAYIREFSKGGVEKIIEPVKHQTGHQKRSVPFIPGNLLCPAVGDQIAGADTGMGTDFDPYDDLSTVPLQDAFERRDFANDTDIPVFNISHIHDLRSVTVNTCAGSANPININAPAYTSAKVIGFFDLDSASTLISDYSMKSNPQVSNQARGKNYGREHVYELQMLSLFVDFLATNVNGLWFSSTTPSFCSWANTYLQTPYFPQGGGNGQSVITSLQRCLPASSQRGTDLTTTDATRMAWLENIANAAKACAVAGITFRSHDPFIGYAPQKQIAVFRAAAGVMSYLNSGVAFSQFSMTHTCVNNVWLNWFQRYSNDPNRPPGLNLGNIAWTNSKTNIYTQWINQLLLDVHDNTIGFLQDMTNWYQGPQTVPLDYAGNLRNPNAQGITQVQVTQADLQAVTNRVMGQPIIWRTRL